jgi:hypothetical protein
MAPAAPRMQCPSLNGGVVFLSLVRILKAAVIASTWISMTSFFVRGCCSKRDLLENGGCYCSG